MMKNFRTFEQIPCKRISLVRALWTALFATCWGPEDPVLLRIIVCLDARNDVNRLIDEGRTDDLRQLL